jgi:hypothetical protein
MDCARNRSLLQSGPKWPTTLILGEAEQSSIGNPDDGGSSVKGKKLRR